MKQFYNGDQYYKNQLNNQKQQAYSALIKGFFDHKNSIPLPDRWDASEKFDDLFQAINFDHPEIFWPNYYNYFWSYDYFGKVVMKPKYFFDSDETEKLRKDAFQWKKKVNSQIPNNVSTAEKIWMIYDYLARQTAYESTGELSVTNTIIGPMQRQTRYSVCEGVAKSFKFLCDDIGVGCIVVSGDAFPRKGEVGPHAWNIVRIQNFYRHLDATWEIGYAHAKGIADDRNFLHTDDQMDRYKWDRGSVPKCI